jgi:hypothetical protein
LGYFFYCTGKSRFKKLYFSFLKSSHVWFEKSESKNQSSKKMFYVDEFASGNLS